MQDSPKEVTFENSALFERLVPTIKLLCNDRIVLYRTRDEAQ